MRLTLEWPPETEKKLHERAAEAGQSVEESALSDDQVDDVFEDMLRKLRAEKRK